MDNASGATPGPIVHLGFAGPLVDLGLAGPSLRALSWLDL
jgi:hypothetical protein